MTRSRERLALWGAYSSNLAIAATVTYAFAAWRIIQLQLPFAFAMLTALGASTFWRRGTVANPKRLIRKIKALILILMIVLISTLSLTISLYPTGGLTGYRPEEPEFTSYATIFPDGDRLLAVAVYIRDSVPARIPVYFPNMTQGNFYQPGGFTGAYASWLTALSRHVVLTSKPNSDAYVWVEPSSSSMSVFMVRNQSVQLMYKA